MAIQENLNPGQILEISGFYWKTCTLHGAVKLGVFTAIGKRAVTARELAKEMGVDRRSLEMLLNALSAMDLVVKRDALYANTPLAMTFLSKDSPDYIGYMIMHHHHLIDSWAQLDVAVRTGGPVRSRMAPRVAEMIDLSKCRRLLDLGGGPGTYAIHFCLKNPQLRATVLDLPTTEPFALKTIDKFGLKDRVGFLPGDYLEEDIRGEYDVAWLSHILHGEGPEACQMIVDKAVSALEPGGMVFIHEFILNNSEDGPLFPALFSLNMLLGTPEGQSYSEEHLRQMFTRAGAKETQRIPFQGPNDSGIILGVF
jgi:predicted O-methyltransferase YrrM